MMKKGIKLLLGIMIATMLLGMPVLADAPEGEGGEEGAPRGRFFDGSHGVLRKRRDSPLT